MNMKKNEAFCILRNICSNRVLDIHEIDKNLYITIWALGDFIIFYKVNWSQVLGVYGFSGTLIFRKNSICENYFDFSNSLYFDIFNIGDISKARFCKSFDDIECFLNFLIKKTKKIKKIHMENVFSTDNFYKRSMIVKSIINK